ncbi:MAG: hypothetical protein WBM00_11015 [Solirubrobacterales bacterium]
MISDDSLFRGTTLHHYLERRIHGLLAEVEKASEDHALQADEEAWVEALVENFDVRVPELGEAWRDRPQETEVDISRNRFSRVVTRAIADLSTPSLAPGYRVVLHVPFEGDYRLFGMQASASTLIPPCGRVLKDEVARTLEYPADSRVDLDTEVKRLRDSLSAYLDFAKKDLAGFPERLAQQARFSIQARRERIEWHRAQPAYTQRPF